MADKDLSSLKRQRTLNKNKLLQIVEFARAIDDQTELEQCIVRLDQVVKLYDIINNIETRIVAISETEEVDLSIENSYYEAAGRLKTSIRHKQSIESPARNGLNMTANATCIGNHSEVKLPKLYIPPFSGDYADWPSFFDMFNTTIHESSLSGVEKFQYLKSLLRGEAASLVRHMRVTESNYLGAFNKLKERYDNQKYIIGSYIRTFREQPNAHSGHVANLRKLRDVSDEVIRGLNVLGNQAETRDPWIIYLLIQKVDEKTQIAWSDYSSDHNHPTIEDFF